MELITTRFGKIQVEEKDVIAVPEGLIGFSSAKRYAIIEREKDYPFKWLQSVDDPSLAFVVTDPLIFCPAYQVKVRPEEIASLQLKDISEAKVLTLVVVPSNPMETRANLRGPLVINTVNNTAKQLILSDEYPLQYKLFVPQSC